MIYTDKKIINFDIFNFNFMHSNDNVSVLKNR